MVSALPEGNDEYSSRPQEEFTRLTTASASDLPLGMTSRNRQSHIVAQASGMVSVQAACTVDEAFVRLRERAVSMDRTLAEIATAVVERRMRFAPL